MWGRYHWASGALAGACILGLALGACAPVAPPGEDAVSSEQQLSSCVAGPRPTTGVQLERVFSTATFAAPLAMFQAPGDAQRFYVVEKGGRVKIATLTGTTTTTFVDLGTRVNAAPQEGGLLGMAFHPGFASNGRVFFAYTAPEPGTSANVRVTIAAAKSNDGGATVDPSSFAQVLSFVPSSPWALGGEIAFGPDGFLYAGFGCGSNTDPQGAAQNLTTLAGKMLRIDVDHGAPYTIPSTNPFAPGSGAAFGTRAEIYASGFRNPWRWSFDRGTGELWAGDVGVSNWEEIDKVVLGGNYGWSAREGAHCAGSPCVTVPGAIDPIVEFSHAEGNAVVGGFVYRGTELPDLVGKYVYGDYGSGRIWSIPTNAASPVAKVLLESGLTMPSFAEGADGELYALDIVHGSIHRLVPAPALAGGIPSKLSQTGCMLAGSPGQPATSLIPFDVRSPLWSDGAEKSRWMALPAGGKIAVRADGDWDLPIGSVLMKTFSLDGKRVETRLFMRHDDGGWAGYSYEWDDLQNDATLLTSSKTKDVGLQTWTFPSRGQCMTCHNGATGGTIGLETAQLDHALTYPDGTTENQIAHLAALGKFGAAGPGLLSPGAASLPDPADVTETSEARARSYLHANCSFCHRPGGSGLGPADLRFSTPLADASVCNTAPTQGTLGVPLAKLLAPGQPGKSLLSLRMHATGRGRMPPLGSAIVDPSGMAIVDAWIADLTTCP